MGLKTHKDLDVYQKSMELVTDIYSITKSFPTKEVYGLTSQIRRSAVSVPSNIAEGAARKSKTEFIQFLYIALGSLSELDTQMDISYRLNYLQSKDELDDEITHVRKLLLGLIKYVKEKS